MSVGVRSGVMHDGSRPDWDGTGPRPIAWTAWYPTGDDAVEEPLSAGGTGEPWFDAGAAARDAPLREAGQPFPAVVLSHGTGGTALDLAWLGRHMAARGFVALAPDHHGNTRAEPRRAEGFVCWWERAADLSALLDGMAFVRDFAGRLDLDGVLVAGFSLGAHTALALLGGVTSMERYGAWAAGGPFARGPDNFPDLADRLPSLLDRSAVFRASWERQGRSYRDARAKAALLLAPAPPVRAFTDASLVAIAAPVHVMTGGADRQAPPAAGAEWLVGRLSRCTLDVVAPQGGHFVFLPQSTQAGRRLAPDMCQDPPAVDRAAIHAAVGSAAERLASTPGTP